MLFCFRKHLWSIPISHSLAKFVSFLHNLTFTRFARAAQMGLRARRKGSQVINVIFFQIPKLRDMILQPWLTEKDHYHSWKFYNINVEVAGHPTIQIIFFKNFFMNLLGSLTPFGTQKGLMCSFPIMPAQNIAPPSLCWHWMWCVSASRFVTSIRSCLEIL